MSWEMELNDQMLEDLYEWIDGIPISRQKKRIERDFSDGYCVAEIVAHFLPSLIDIHNYTPAFNSQQKMANWGMLNSKVFNRFGLNVPANIVTNISNCKPGYIEVLLHNLRYKIEEKLAQMESAQMTTNASLSGRQKITAKSTARAQMESSLFQPGKATGGKVAHQLKIDFEEKVQECLEKDERIETLNARVRRLEHLVQLKDVRIKELTARLDKYRPTAVIAGQLNNMRRDANNDDYDQVDEQPNYDQDYDQNNYEGDENFQGNGY